MFRSASKPAFFISFSLCILGAYPCYADGLSGLDALAIPFIFLVILGVLGVQLVCLHFLKNGGWFAALIGSLVGVVSIVLCLGCIYLLQTLFPDNRDTSVYWIWFWVDAIATAFAIYRGFYLLYRSAQHEPHNK